MQQPTIGPNGNFSLANADNVSGLYFPLMNPAGMISSVTPTLAGDSKTGQNNFLLPPAGNETLRESRATRNFWCAVKGQQPWSVAGQSAAQQAQRFGPGRESVTLQAGLLWQEAERENPALGLKASVLSFVPAAAEPVEIMQVTIENSSDHAITLTPTAAIPLYGRSADNLRDHRHVTSLLQRLRAVRYGLELSATITFDERGHQPGRDCYTVLGAEEENQPPIGFLGNMEDFVGEGGGCDWPRAVVTDEVPFRPAGTEWAGCEMVAALRFAEVTLHPGEKRRYQLVMGINAPGERYLSAKNVEKALAQTKAWWANRAGIALETGDPFFDHWMRWVGAQPEMRRICGCSFLPHHDYGKGGRGWRDLWQDCLGLLLSDPAPLRKELVQFFGGVRTDGTNATIIGKNPGGFVADRNHIVRVWMDHGFWPLLTIRLYIDQTGDDSILLEQQPYFCDAQICRGEKINAGWNPANGTLLGGEKTPITGTVLEHLLLQNVTAYFDAGEHGMIRLRGADWNDGLDMARERGESVAFTAAYAGNFALLATLCRRLGENDNHKLFLEKAFWQLFCAVGMALSDPAARRLAREAYEAESWTGDKVAVSPQEAAALLDRLHDSLTALIRENEWISDGADRHWFNSYYDNHGRPVEGVQAGNVRMMLTGQVFSILSGTATRAQTAEIIRAVDWYLYYPTRGGYCLNTDFHEVKLDLGRMFGFVYGSKENGAAFSHMAVMYAYALYSRGFAKEGWKVLRALKEQCRNFAVSKCYPGIPEYFDDTGRGMYPYLTGAASWLVLTIQTQMFGIRGQEGDLCIDPKLCAEQFDGAGMAVARCIFAGRKLIVRICNPLRYDYGEYRVKEVRLDGKTALQPQNDALVIERAALLGCDAETEHELEVLLCGK